MPELNLFKNFNQDHAFWDILASYLSLKDIQALKMTCQLFKGQLDKMHVAWQPYLNKLHAIDETIRVTPEKGKTIPETFITGFEKVRTRQLAEIAYLQENHGKTFFAAFSPHIKAALESKEPLRLHDLVAISTELDAVNRGLIDPVIIRARNFGIWLSLDEKGITRLPQALFDYPLYAAFWSNLKILDFSDNFVQSLPRNIGERLQSLLTLNCDNNQLVELPESIGDLTALEQLCVRNNQLNALPDSIGNLTSLQLLSLENNQLTVLPATLDLSVVHGVQKQNPRPGSASGEVTKKPVMDDGNNAKRQKRATAEDEPVIESRNHPDPNPAPLTYQFDVENANASDELKKKRAIDADNSSAKRQKTSESEDDVMDFEPALRSSMKRK